MTTPNWDDDTLPQQHLPSSIIDHLDFHPKCDLEECTRPATIALNFCCKCVTFSCEPCRKTTRKVFERRRKYSDFGCRKCDSWFPFPARWHSIVLKETPL